MRVLPSLVLLALGACASAPAASPPPMTATAPAMADPPFTAAQIRDATQVGRTYDFELEIPGRPVSGVRIHFVEVTAEHARVERSVVDDQGALMAPTDASTVSWDELVKHAAWPRAATTVEAAEISVPAGHFADALLYTVREIEDGKPKVTRAWFARALPGAPVVHVVEIDGREVSRMRLVRHSP